MGINLEMGDAQDTTALETLENSLNTLLSNYNPEYYSQYVGFVNASPNPMEFVRFKIDEDITAEEQEIIAKAKANGTYLKAPNGKPSNLTPRQWVQVRTKAFKRWFGNWDIGAMVTPIHRSKGGFKNLTEAEKWAKENLQGKSVRNLFTNEEISIGSKSIKEMLDPKFAKNVNEQVHMSALQSVLDFIETGIPAEIHKDTKERGFDVMRLYNAIEIDGVVYRVKSTVRKVKQGDRYYTYEVQEMELLEDTQEALGLLNTDNGRQLNSNNSITGAKLLKGVKKTNSNEEILSYSKVVDANGEPLVVYHGSNWKGITTFDRSQSKRRRSGLREYGHFFTTNRALAEMYAAVEDAPDVKEEIDSLDAQIEQAAEAKDIGKMLDLYTEKERITRNLGGRVYEVFLNLRDVAEFDADYQADKGWYNLKADVGYKTAIGRDAMEAYAGQNSMTGDRLRKDGIIGRNIIDLFVGTENKEALKPYYDKYGGDVFLVFDPQNIKSSTENVGTFDATNPDIRYLRGSSEGEVYGWMSDGKIYLTEKGLNPETPIHEYTHIWDAVCQRENPKLWAEGVALMKQTPLWEQVRTNPAYADIADNENALASEVHARLAAPGGTAVLVEMMEQQKAEATLIGRIHNWLRKFWRWLRKKEMPESKLNVDKFARMPLKDLAMGKSILNGIASANGKQKVAGQEIMDAFGDVPMAQIGRRRQEEMYAILAKRRQDLSDAEKLAVIAELDKLDNNKLVNAAFHYFVNGTVRLPEDMPKVEQAVKVAEIAKVDPAAYKSPMELINAHADVKLKEARIDPDTVSTLSNKVEYEDGLTVYDVEESEESRQNMRRIINTHFGEDSSPWCLLQGDGKGNLTDESARYWVHYDAQPKRVAFQNGKLLAFFASDGEPTWWDRKDAPHEGIPATRKLPDNSGRVGTVEVDEEMQDWGDYADVHLGKQGDKIYEGWIDEDTIDFREIREEDTIYHYSWDIEGTLTTYMEKNVSGSSFPKRSAIWNEGDVESVTDENGTIYDFSRGNLERIQSRGKTIYEDSHVYWAYDGLLRDVSETTEKGNKRVWFDKFEDVERVEESNANGIITFNMQRHTNGAMASASMLDENGVRTFVSFDTGGGVRQYRVGDDVAFRHGNEILEVTAGMMDLAPLQILVQADKVKKDIEQRVSEYAEWAKQYAAEQAQVAESVREPYANPEDFERQMNEQLKAATSKGSIRYRTKHLSRESQDSENLDEINAQYNERLLALDKNRDAKDRVLHLGRPQDFLRAAGIKDAEIEMEFDKFVKKSSETYKNDHPFTAEDILNLPQALNAPIAVFDSTNGRDKVILTEIKKDGKNFIVTINAVERRRKGGTILEVNSIETLYPKRSKGIVHWISKELIANVDTEKALAWLEALRTNRETELTEQELVDATKVVQDFEKSKAKSEKNRHRTASEEARQRVISAQAQTLSTAEIEEYANEVSSLSSKRDAKIIYIEKKLILFLHFFAENFAETNKVVTFAPQMLL